MIGSAWESLRANRRSRRTPINRPTFHSAARATIHRYKTRGVLEKDNEAKIAKVSCLSQKGSPKAYKSMVVYVTKHADAVRLLEDQYFNMDGESAFTGLFEPRYGPMQCFKCLGLGHKALSCTRPQLCSRCAQPGHRHNECQTDRPGCAVYSGPHDSSSRQCRVLYPATDV
jgi:hypothetical protein